MFSIIASIGALLISQSVYAQSESDLDQKIEELKNTTLPQAVESYGCFEEAANLSSRYLSLRKLILSGESGTDLDAYKAFEKLKEKESQVNAAIKEFVQTMTNDTESLPAIRTKLETLESGSTELSDLLTEASLEEFRVLSITEHSRDLIQSFSVENKESIEVINSSKCKSIKTQESIQTFIDDAHHSLEEIDKMHAYIMLLRLKRNKMVSHIIAKLRRYLNEKYADIAEENLSNIALQLNAAIKLDQVGGELIRWWISKSTQGLAKNRHLKYLEYQRPLRQLRYLSSQINSYEKSIIAIQGSSSEAKNVYFQRIENMRSSVNKSLTRLEKKGWKGQMKRQVFLNKRRLQKVNSYPAECKQALERHLNTAEQRITNINEFEEVLVPQYRLVVDTCSRRRK